MHRLFTNKTAC